MPPSLYRDTSRALIRIIGDDAGNFLQDLVTNDVRLLDQGNGIYAALLTPQGKYLVDFIMLMSEDRSIQLDLPASALEDTVRRLNMYRLRRALEIAPQDSPSVWCLFGPGAIEAAGGSGKRGSCTVRNRHMALIDPRHPDLGLRVYGHDISCWLGETPWRRATEQEWDAHRIKLGVPEGGKDLWPEGLFPLEAGFEALNGVDFRKGCYVGQEVTARMRHRGALRRGIRRIRLLGIPPPPGTEIRADGKPAGTLLSSTASGHALAYLRLERAGSATNLVANGIGLALLED